MRAGYLFRRIAGRITGWLMRSSFDGENAVVVVPGCCVCRRFQFLEELNDEPNDIMNCPYNSARWQLVHLLGSFGRVSSLPGHNLPLRILYVCFAGLTSGEVIWNISVNFFTANFTFKIEFGIYCTPTWKLQCKEHEKFKKLTLNFVEVPEESMNGARSQ
ncbi:hypothetical protein KQX54_009647 [Cotesia glomerata]|uniref:Uncharacterized protein n=1 Tax=Cotesia glomerata TaxID=32391 RepID=A0AAV7J2C8_COTGL|nr:hypothetical protein KQX54_009647 [Cotesia glomerata]